MHFDWTHNVRNSAWGSASRAEDSRDVLASVSSVLSWDAASIYCPLTFVSYLWISLENHAATIRVPLILWFDYGGNKFYFRVVSILHATKMETCYSVGPQVISWKFQNCSYCKECVIFVEESRNAGLVNPFVVPLPEVDFSVLPFLLLWVVYIGSVWKFLFLLKKIDKISNICD